MGYKIIAGKFVGGEIFLIKEKIIVWIDTKQIELTQEEVESVKILTEEDKKNLSRAAGLGIAGSILLGPVGLVAGVLASGNKKEVTFECQLSNGEKFLAVTDPRIYQKLLSYCY